MLTNEEIEIIKHMCGLDHSDKPYRNYFETGPESKDYPILEGLHARGYLRKRKNVFNEMSDSWLYHCTDECIEMFNNIRRPAHDH